MSDDTPLEQLEAASRDVEDLATRVVLRGRAFGAEVGAHNRIEIVRRRLKLAQDELASYPGSADDITDE
ncbi:hypothetical protein WPS_00510 [Vulcanimicrobium alpinum]|uniref:Uncharacterized protein n=1 Tax=Vulcanimicrobium alpinum TaxID=3016050 RepID=A0AAN1XRR3_UNVUL|nr:hypothetical protein [Vulcanimicrobium alpinum]BDE04775.1 hypothetical protein WPS_00510 [Vulcanimicrobium alpinum]